KVASFGAYRLFASVAWTFKVWSGMLVQVKDDVGQRRVRRGVRDRVIKMEFGTYLHSLMLIPAQVIRRARSRVFRLLTYRPSVELLFTLHDHKSLPLRC
ncbi:MAG: hypothetical protein AAGD07_04855, partial [Planctomycetota bacterium]